MQKLTKNVAEATSAFTAYNEATKRRRFSVDDIVSDETIAEMLIPTLDAAMKEHVLTPDQLPDKDDAAPTKKLKSGDPADTTMTDAFAGASSSTGADGSAADATSTHTPGDGKKLLSSYSAHKRSWATNMETWGSDR